jgi:hypothetical protein
MLPYVPEALAASIIRAVTLDRCGSTAYETDLIKTIVH